PWRGWASDNLTAGRYAHLVARDAPLLPRHRVAPVNPCLIGLAVQLGLCADGARAVERGPLGDSIAVLEVILIGVRVVGFEVGTRGSARPSIEHHSPSHAPSISMGEARSIRASDFRVSLGEAG